MLLIVTKTIAKFNARNVGAGVRTPQEQLDNGGLFWVDKQNDSRNEWAFYVCQTNPATKNKQTLR